jgi:hypothetical protein
MLDMARSNGARQLSRYDVLRTDVFERTWKCIPWILHLNNLQCDRSAVKPGGMVQVKWPFSRAL